jgi:hypothetical protein
MSVIARLAEETRLKRKSGQRSRIKGQYPLNTGTILCSCLRMKHLINREPLEGEHPLPSGCIRMERQNLHKCKYPYMVVAGRVKWFCDDHREAGAKYAITTNIEVIEEMIKNGQPIPLGFPFITVIESELHGKVEALASINIDGKSCRRNFPLENAETSSLGRALAKMGYGLIGSGLASAEEVEDGMKRRSGNASKNTGNVS